MSAAYRLLLRRKPLRCKAQSVISDRQGGVKAR